MQGSIVITMKRLLISLVLVLFFFSQSFAIENKAVKELTELSVMRLDIGRAALILAKEVYPDLDIELYSKEIDRMVNNVRNITKGSTDPDYRVRVLNTYFYKMEKIEYDLSDPNVKKLENMYLNGILDTKKGSCVTMPLLYLAIAQRLEYPVFPVAAPWHLFLRYVDSDLKEQNIEATSGGGHVSDEENIAVLQISPKAIESGAYLRTMSYSEFLGDLIAQNGIYWGQSGNYFKAIDYLETALKLNPYSADIHKVLGISYMMLSKEASRLLYPIQSSFPELYMQIANDHLRKADEMGVTNLSNTNYIVEQRKATEEFRKKQLSKRGQ